jgi:hypothetical protein
MKTPPIAAIFPVVIIASLSVSSCQSIKTPQKIEDNTRDESNKSLEPPSNVVKVLNNITCANCNQEQINDIWQECLKQGYVTKSPLQRVIASRGISELVTVRYTYYTVKHYTKTSTDENGIVMENHQSLQIPEYRRVSGQCRGSEYILD